MADLPIGNDLIVFVKEEEGFSAVPYLCPARYWTIGYGHRCSPTHSPIEIYDAEQILVADLREHQGKALALAPNLARHPHALDALTDLCFNIGAGPIRESGTLKLLQQEDWPAAALRFRTWNKAHVDGVLVELDGLTKRRARGAAWIMAELGPDFSDVRGGASTR